MKKITSLSLGLSFLIMSFTGIMLFLCPHGRVAYWSDWRLFGLSKTQYGELHTTSMIMFVFFGILHIYYNWKPIVNYLKGADRKISFTKKEFVVALGLNLIFITGTLFALQPFKGFLDFEENLKDNWTKQYGEPPFGHAEETKLKVFCKKLNIDLNKAKEILKSKNILFEESETLKTIAKNNNTTPNDIYQLIKNASPKSNSEDIPSGLGRKSLKELSDTGKIDLKNSIKLLKTKGLSDISPDSKIRNIADELGLTPVDVYKMLKVD